MIRIASILLMRDGLVCVSKRAEGKEYAGYVQTPGGKIENDEFPKDGAVRELKEETGLVIDPKRLIDAGRSTCINTKGKEFVVITYIVFLKEGESPLNAENDCDWLFTAPKILSSGVCGRLVPGLIPVLKSAFDLDYKAPSV